MSNEPPSQRRRASRLATILVTVLVALGVALAAVVYLPKLSDQRSASQLSGPCRSVLDRYVTVATASALATRSARKAGNHWDDVWNGYTRGQMSRAEYDAGMRAFRVDARATMAAYRMTKRQVALLNRASAACDTVPTACARVFHQVPRNVAHERRELAAVNAMLRTAQHQADAWNAHDVSAVNAATAAHNAAERGLDVQIARHNRLVRTYAAAQDSCAAAL